MATTGIFNGTNLLVKIAGDNVGHTTSCTLSLTHDLPDITTKDSKGWSEMISGVRGGSISFDGMIDYGDKNSPIKLSDYILGRTAVVVVFGTEQTGDIIYTSTGYLANIDQSADHEAGASYSGTITITGEIIKSEFSTTTTEAADD